MPKLVLTSVLSQQQKVNLHSMSHLCLSWSLINHIHKPLTMILDLNRCLSSLICFSEGHMCPFFQYLSLFACEVYHLSALILTCVLLLNMRENIISSRILSWFIPFISFSIFLILSLEVISNVLGS